jgi:hypothetical protein|tara:strand:+ start:162 stop:425 length:264 start_codon:yes stop_codon:yes gene_type:complete
MDLELLLLGYPPIIIAAVEIIWSLKLLLKSPLFLNVLLSISITLLNTFSLYVLYLIFFTETWPTYVPYILIGISTILIIIQIIKNRK